MPLYEYVCEKDGTRLELMRTMAEADAPLPEEVAKGRAFVRAISTFSPGGAAGGRASGTSLPLGPCCPCGKGRGQCSN